MLSSWKPACVSGVIGKQRKLIGPRRSPMLTDAPQGPAAVCHGLANAQSPTAGANPTQNSIRNSAQPFCGARALRRRREGVVINKLSLTLPTTILLSSQSPTHAAGVPDRAGL